MKANRDNDVSKMVVISPVAIMMVVSGLGCVTA